MRQLFLLLSILALVSKGTISAQDTLRKSGWNFGALPSVMFDSDIGFQYGAIVNAFQYGDGSLYPDYRYMIYAEWSRQTKGGAINQLFFDAPHLLPGGYRLTAEAGYFTEKALDLYGFNGREAVYDEDLTDPSSPDYISRMYYRHQRKQLRMSVDVQKDIRADWRWVAGIMFLDYRLGSVDLESLNKGLTGGDVLPDVPLLYDRYRSWGVIHEDDAEGGMHTFFRAGIVYDRRDTEANPMKGLWSEAVLWSAPGFSGDGGGFLRYNLIHRHYLTLRKDVLSLAARVAAQGTLAGETPWYTMPLMLSSFDKSTTRDGLGGAKTVRGMLRNRVVGEGIAYANAELRWKALRGIVWNQNYYVALSAFTDAGLVTDPYLLNSSGIPEEYRWDSRPDAPHISGGLGLHLALNENFIIALDYGHAFSARDGESGLYINIGFLY